MEQRHGFFNFLVRRNYFSLTKTAGRLKIKRQALRYPMQRLNISATNGEEKDKAAPAGKEISQL